MTTIVQLDLACWACGQRSRHHGIGSTSSFGSPDLDLRPAELQRGTMSSWVQLCPHCGYVAADIERPPEAQAPVRQAMQDPAWQDLEQRWAGPPLTGLFLRHALLARAQGDLQRAAMATLHAAWASDDAKDAVLAARLRRDAAELLRAWLAGPATGPASVQLTARVQLLDILRRAGAWAEAEALCEDLRAAKPEGTIAAVLAFESRLIHGRDDGCHTISEALSPASGGHPH